MMGFDLDTVVQFGAGGPHFSGHKSQFGDRATQFSGKDTRGPFVWFAFAAGHGVKEPDVVGANKPCVPGHDGDGYNVREPRVVAADVLHAPGRDAEEPGILRRR